MGKIRAVTLGDEQSEKEQKRKAEARRQTKQSKKPFDKSQGKGNKDNDQANDGDGSVVKPEYKKIVDQVESGEQSTIGNQQSTKKKKETKVKTRSKKYKEVAGMVDKTKLYPMADAISLVKKTSMTKFDGTVELHINLNPEALGETKSFRTAVHLPHGTGKTVKVVIADEAIIAEIKAGKINFDILVAHPSMMPKLAQVAKILGPKGLMPNPKTGTVTPDPEKRAKELTMGEVNIKTEPSNAIIHMPIGKVSFDDAKILENVQAVLSSIGKSKIVRATLTATMSPGVKLQLN